MWKNTLILNAPMARRLKHLGCGYKRCHRTMTMGLGVMKCRAVCELEEELKRWLRKQGVRL